MWEAWPRLGQRWEVRNRGKGRRAQWQEVRSSGPGPSLSLSAMALAWCKVPPQGHSNRPCDQGLKTLKPWTNETCPPSHGGPGVLPPLGTAEDSRLSSAERGGRSARAWAPPASSPLDCRAAGLEGPCSWATCCGTLCDPSDDRPHRAHAASAAMKGLLSHTGERGLRGPGTVARTGLPVVSSMTPRQATRLLRGSPDTQDSAPRSMANSRPRAAPLPSTASGRLLSGTAVSAARCSQLSPARPPLLCSLGPVCPHVGSEGGQLAALEKGARAGPSHAAVWTRASAGGPLGSAVRPQGARVPVSMPGAPESQWPLEDSSLPLSLRLPESPCPALPFTREPPSWPQGP